MEKNVVSTWGRTGYVYSYYGHAYFEHCTTSNCIYVDKMTERGKDSI